MGQKRLILISAVLAVAILTTVHLTLVRAEVGIEDAPPETSTFYGTVKLNGANVLLDGSAKVSAWIGGAWIVEADPEVFEGDTVYNINVSGDPTELEGKQVIFKIGSVTADQAGTWRSGTSMQLNLTGWSNKVFLPFTSK